MSGIFETVQKNLEARGFSVRTFPDGNSAAAYLNGVIDGVKVGFGGSVTLDTTGLYPLLSAHNDVHWHWTGGAEELKDAMTADVYVSSANALAESGEIINIDGRGNRVAGTLYGAERLYLVIGKNKLAPTFEDALWRARNIAAPKNAKRLGVKTPCAIRGDHCYDCSSPERICRGLVVLWRPMLGMNTEILLVEEDLGL